MKKNFSQKIFTWSLVAGLALGILTGIRPAVGAIGSLGSFVPSVPVTVVADYPYAIKEELEDVITRSLARNIESVLQEKVLSVVSLNTFSCRTLSIFLANERVITSSSSSFMA